MFRISSLIAIVLLAIANIQFAFGQKKERVTPNKTEVKRLQIGDPIPPEIWDMAMQVVNHPVGKKHRSLKEFKNADLIILDFWSTWCAPCIELMPKVIALEKQFEGKFKPVFITHEDRAKIESFFIKQQLTLESMVGDITLEKVFPKKSVPHEVWIKKGKVFAITDDYYVNEQTIRGVLENKINYLPEKVFNNLYDLNQPLIVDGNGGGKNDLLYHSVFTKYLDGIGGGGTGSDAQGRYKIRFLNGTVFQLFKSIAARFDPAFWHSNRLINISSKKNILSDLNTAEPKSREHFFCYELIVPEKMKDKAAIIAFDDLNRFFGIRYGLHAEIKNVATKCWVLKKGDNNFSGFSKGGKKEEVKAGNKIYEINVPFEQYFRRLTKINSKQPYPFVNETGIKGNVDMVLFSEGTDIEIIRKSLESYGLTLVLEKRSIDMLLISDKQQ